MPRYALLAVIPLAVAAAFLARPAAPATLPKPMMADAEFVAVRAVVRPAPGEDPFATIPWQTSLWAARVKAAAEGKPILLWEMDGHPLGCG